MSTLAVTFLRTHPDFPYFPGQTVELEITAAGPILAAGFARISNPAISPAPAADSYARPETSAYERAMMPDPAPTTPPAEEELPSVNY